MIFTHTLHGDFETKSGNPISAGAHVYVEDSEALLMTYSLGDDPVVHCWSPATGEDMPAQLLTWLRDPSIQLAFHNVEFDRTNMVAWGWDKRYGIPLNPERFLCTMTWAKMCRLPGGLDELCKVLGVPDTYSKKDGKSLIMKFCVPKADGSFVLPHEDPAGWERFVEYAKADITAMRECARRMPQVFSAVERALHGYTMTMNDRGVGIDRKLAASATAQADELKKRYKKHGQQLAIQSVRDAQGSAEDAAAAAEMNVASQKAILEFLRGYGVKLDDARGATIERFLDTAQAELLPDTVRSLLATRLKANKASVAKYSAVLKGTSSDDRLRGTINFYGAGTGRDAGRRFQPQNLARPVYVGEKFKNLTMEGACDIVKQGHAELLFEEPMQLLSDCVRGVLVPAAGRKFCGADLSSIEGRVLPWMAREDWKVRYYADLDAGRVKYDGYQLAYAVAFGVDPATVTKAQRTLGKPIELATGYQGGVGALITFATLYRIDLDDMASKAREASDPYLWQECAKSYNWYLEKDMTHGLPQDTFTGCLYIVKAWRAKHPMTVAMWKACEEAFKNAVHHPGVRFEAARDTYFSSSAGWVFAQLPSGRLLVYPWAHITDQGKCAYMGVNPFTKKWGAIYTYGGKLCIAEGTLVLTRQDGWTAIENITSEHEVWDGVEWVSCAGAVYNGDKEVICAYGAWMTPDHEVLTEEGWMCASQSKGHNRASSRLPDGVELPQQRREEVSVDGWLRLRSDETDGRERTAEAIEARDSRVVRMPAQGDHKQTQVDARNVEASRIRSLAQYARSLPPTNTSSLAKLWRAGHNCMRSLASCVRKLLGGHGSDLCLRTDARQDRQQQRILTGELSVGFAQRAEQQSKVECAHRFGDRSTACSSVGGEEVNTVLSTGGWRPVGEARGAARLHSKVYDIVNCGPRNRFVVWADGAPLIVHNCENLDQAIARDVLFWNIPHVENAGYPIVMRVHDELITEPEDKPEFSGKHLAKLIATPHSWCADLPLNAAGEDLYRYQK